MPEQEEWQPKIISRDPFQEGGFTFLKRALRTALEDEQSTVVIDSGRLKITYVHSPDNVTFEDGITTVEGASLQAELRFRQVASQYVIQRGLDELDHKAT